MRSRNFQTTRILLLEEHPVVREGISHIIESQSNWVICGSIGHMEQVLPTIQEQDPDLLIADVLLGGLSQIEWIKQIKRFYPELLILIFSNGDERIYAERALHAGASGYLMQTASTEDLLCAIRTVLEGKIYVSAAVAARVLRQVFGPVPEGGPIESLTNRELQVLQLIGQGLSTREVAQRLHLSVKTVETYRARLKDKLCLRNAVELIQFATRWTQENLQEVGDSLTPKRGSNPIQRKR